MVIKDAIDWALDKQRTDRTCISELEKTEKTAIGTKVEILFKKEFGIDGGIIFDCSLPDVEFDVKFTINNNWTIPPETYRRNGFCLLMRSDGRTFSLGLFQAKKRFLTKGKNRDGKVTINKDGKKKIVWVIQDEALPRSLECQN